MNKYEFQQKLEEGSALIDKGEFEQAVEIFDVLNLDSVRDPRLLQSVAKAYEKCQRYEDAEYLLLQARDCAPKSRGVIFHLCTLAIKAGNLDDAMKYYNDFCEIAKYDSERFILQYRIAKAEKRSDAELIEILEKFKEEEPDDRWMYELAKLYTMNGRTQEALELCDEITLWFYNGKYVNLAKELKAYLTGELIPEDEPVVDEQEENTVVHLTSLRDETSELAGETEEDGQAQTGTDAAAYEAETVPETETAPEPETETETTPEAETETTPEAETAPEPETETETTPETVTESVPESTAAAKAAPQEEAKPEEKAYEPEMRSHCTDGMDTDDLLSPDPATAANAAHVRDLLSGAALTVAGALTNLKEALAPAIDPDFFPDQQSFVLDVRTGKLALEAGNEATKQPAAADPAALKEAENALQEAKSAIAAMQAEMNLSREELERVGEAVAAAKAELQTVDAALQERKAALSAAEAVLEETAAKQKAAEELLQETAAKQAAAEEGLAGAEAKKQELADAIAALEEKRAAAEEESRRLTEALEAAKTIPETVEEKTEVSAEEPAKENIETPAEEPVKETVEETVQETAEEPAKENDEVSVEEPVKEPVEEPVPEAAAEPVREAFEAVKTTEETNARAAEEKAAAIWGFDLSEINQVKIEEKESFAVIEKETDEEAEQPADEAAFSSEAIGKTKEETEEDPPESYVKEVVDAVNGAAAAVAFGKDYEAASGEEAAEEKPEEAAEEAPEEEPIRIFERREEAQTEEEEPAEAPAPAEAAEEAPEEEPAPQRINPDEMSEFEIYLTIRKKISERLGNLPLDSRNLGDQWHILMYGDSDEEVLVNARRLLHAIAEENGDELGKVVKIHASKLKGIRIQDVVSQFMGRKVVVQGAALLSDEQAAEFAKMLQAHDKELLVCLTDTLENIVGLSDRVPGLTEAFTGVYDGNDPTARDLLNQVREYLDKEDALLTPEAAREVYAVADDLIKQKDPDPKGRILHLAERALHYAEHTGLFGMFTGHIDDDGFLHVTEKNVRKAEES